MVADALEDKLHNSHMALLKDKGWVKDRVPIALVKDTGDGETVIIERLALERR